MNRIARPWLLLLVLLGAASAPATGPLRVLASNPRYFTDGSGRAIYLTGSHVWENLQDRGTVSPPPPFNYTAYLDFLQARNHNFVRLWNWEQARWAPWTTGEDYVTPLPFARTGPGTALDGGAKFNLDQFNQAYFDRLRARVIAARDRGIYVSIMLFEGWSIDNVGKGPGNPWPGHPFHGSNNVNGVNGDLNGNGQGEETHTLANATVTAKQDAYVRKVVDTVNDLDNVLYEIANESGSTIPGSTDWQYHMIDLVHSYEAGKPKKHPVGMTFQYPNGNNSALFSSPADWISPNGAGGYDSSPPAATGAKVILSDTDHIWGEGGDRTWVWKSFTRGIHTLFMDGGIETFPATNDWRESARRAMGQSRSYADRMNLAAMTPRGDLTSTGYALAAVGAEYLVYQAGSGAFTVNLAVGSYSAEWLNPATGAASAGGTFAGGSTVSFTPPFGGDAVLYLKAGSASPPSAGELVGLWAMDEGSGTTVGDSSGKGNTGTLLNGAAWTSGKTGTAVTLDGVDDHIRVPSSTSLNSTTSQLTVAAWIYRNANQASWRLVLSRQRGTSWDDQYILGFLDNAYQFGVNASGTSGLASGGMAPNGQWIHLAGTYDGTAARLYVNGTQVASVPASGSILIDASRPLLIGAGQNDSTSAVQEAFSGRVDDVRVYSKALAASEIQSLAASAPPPPGSGTGLTGQYFDNVDFTVPRVTRTDATVDFDWGTGSPDPSIGADTFSIRWTGQVQPALSETYTFTTSTDDGVRLWVNGQLLVDKWIDQAATEWSGSIALSAGQKYSIKMEFYENGGLASAKLFWSSPSTPKQVVPQNRLYPAPPSGGTGLTGQYFDNSDFTNLKVTRTDATVNFDWASGSPDPSIGIDTFSVRWTGQVQAQFSETYTFTTTTDDGVRLWVNGQLIIDQWVLQSATEWSGSIALTAGQMYSIKMEFYENGGLAVAKLLWSSPSTPKQPIPQGRLFP